MESVQVYFVVAALTAGSQAPQAVSVEGPMEPLRCRKIAASYDSSKRQRRIWQAQCVNEADLRIKLTLYNCAPRDFLSQIDGHRSVKISYSCTP